MQMFPLPRRRRLPTAALLAILLCCAGCATSGKTATGGSDETGPPRTAGSGTSGADPSMQTHACSAPASSPRGSCAGCSVSCEDKEAICVAGEEWPSGGPSCQKPAMCACH